MTTTRARAPPGRLFQTFWKLDEGEENMTKAAKLRAEEERMLRWLLRRADALNIAYGALECEEWGHTEMKVEILEALEEMRAEAHEWFVSYRRALGISDPLA
jgi:hypothetical protein